MPDGNSKLTQTLKSILADYPIQPNTRNILFTDANDIADQLEERRSELGNTEKWLGDASIYKRASIFIMLACDKNSCSVRVKPKHLKFEHLKRIRMVTNVMPLLNATDRVVPITKLMCNVYLEDNEKVSKFRDEWAAIAIKIINTCPAADLTGSPYAAAVASLYIAQSCCHDQPKYFVQREFTEALGITGVTIRSRVKLLSDNSSCIIREKKNTWKLV